MKWSCFLFAAMLSVTGCSTGEVAPATRHYRMGFQSSAPRYDDFNLFIQSLELWVQRADAAMITTEVPWDSLYGGVSPQKFILNNYVGVVEYYKSQNFKVWVYIDPANGLNRTSDANALVALGTSIAQDSVQRLYRRFVFVMDSMLAPDHLGLALETNLIRAASSSAIYNGVKAAANAAAADVKAYDPFVKLSVSVQADVAWGYLNGTASYAGISQDLTDFTFVEELGVSSYPYFNLSSPQDLPLNYYSRLTEGTSLPLFVSEGGWTSQPLVGPNQQAIAGSNALQQRYIQQQSQMLDEAKAIAWFQLTFTDIDVDHLPGNVDPSIKYFAYLGLVDINLQAKPSLATWDGIFKRTLSQ